MTRFKFFLLSAALVLAGCEKAPEQTATETGPGDATEAEITVDVQPSVETVTETDARVDAPESEQAMTEDARKEGVTVTSGEDAEVPEGFPSDVYIYSPAEVVTAMDMPEGSVLGLTTADDAAAIAEAYKREMLARDWAEQTSVNTGAQMMMTYKKGERTTNVTIGSQDGAAQIMLTASKD